MVHYNIPFKVRKQPVLDPDFVPLAAFHRTYKAYAKEPIAIMLERENGQRFVQRTEIIGDQNSADCDKGYVERIVKLLLWGVGGYKVTIFGNENVADFIKKEYSWNEKRAFDAAFMESVYNRRFEVASGNYDDAPETLEHFIPTARSTAQTGNRIGLCAKGTELIISAVTDGKTVFSDQITWHPKVTSDPKYHQEQIKKALKRAVGKLSRVDSIGISSPGVYIQNQTRMTPIFRSVAPEAYETHIKNIFIDAAREVAPGVPLLVANDSDAMALAHSTEPEEKVATLGLSLGVGFSSGYVDAEGRLSGRMNKLAFAPVDGNRDASKDEWSGDAGVGVQYFSQEAVLRLAKKVDLHLPDGSKFEQFKHVQEIASKGNAEAAKIFETIGGYLGHALALYREVYDAPNLTLSGRMMEGQTGKMILAAASEVLRSDYSRIATYDIRLCVGNDVPDTSLISAALPLVS